MVNITLYVEGGGDLKARCREGFRKFLEKAGLEGQMPRIVACGSRENAFDSFEIALRAGNSIPMLLVDAEVPLEAANRWEHLRQEDGWNRPDGAGDAHCHLMVQVMETWFLADTDALASFYGNGFRANALPGNPRVEEIRKDDVLKGLGRASRESKKRSYDKGSHSFKILGTINPSLVESAAPSAKVFLDVLRAGGPKP